jgi:hypothetical protein
MNSGKSSTNKAVFNMSALHSAKKVAINSNKELAERHLDVSPGSIAIAVGLDKSPGRLVDHKSIAAKVVMGSHLIDFETIEICPYHKGEMIIARDEANPESYGCNKCVFERRL